MFKDKEVRVVLSEEANEIFEELNEIVGEEKLEKWKVLSIKLY